MLPVSMFAMAIVIVKAVFAAMVSPFAGLTNLAEGMAVVAGI